MLTWVNDLVSIIVTPPECVTLVQHLYIVTHLYQLHKFADLHLPNMQVDLENKDDLEFFIADFSSTKDRFFLQPDTGLWSMQLKHHNLK